MKPSSELQKTDVSGEPVQENVNFLIQKTANDTDYTKFKQTRVSLKFWRLSIIWINTRNWKVTQLLCNIIFSSWWVFNWTQFVELVICAACFGRAEEKRHCSRLRTFDAEQTTFINCIVHFFQWQINISYLTRFFTFLHNMPVMHHVARLSKLL